MSLSKRFVPEVVHYLHGLVRLAVPRPAGVAARGLAPPFRPVGAESRLLVLDADADADAEATRSVALLASEISRFSQENTSILV